MMLSFNFIETAGIKFGSELREMDWIYCKEIRLVMFS